MPVLDWIGKNAVVNHHRETPYRLIHCDSALSAGTVNDGNLLIQGDNLEALKALLPYYAGKVKCVYIDPPYNTGNESWVYNDNVNSPEIKEWLGKVVGKETEDLSRHDKWLCMMYPRIRLLREFLQEDGYIAVSIDDNELTNLDSLMTEIFGAHNRIACAPWKSEPSGGKQKGFLRVGHEYLVVYAKSAQVELSYEEKAVTGTSLKDEFGPYIKGREFLKWGAQSERKDRQKMWFALKAPDGTEVFPIRNDGKEGRWRIGPQNENTRMALENPNWMHWEKRPFDEGVTVNGNKERWVPYEKVRETKKYFGWGTWLDGIGSNSSATEEIKSIFKDKIFDTPKPTSLLCWLFNLAGEDDALFLDSFSGSGTTAHSVLELNKKDGGNRKFILIEMDENIARNITSERLKRVICGYDKNGDPSKPVEGLGGGFRYCKLGVPIFDEFGDIDCRVTFSDLAAHIFFVECGIPIPRKAKGHTPLIGTYQDKAIYLLFSQAKSDSISRDTESKVLTPQVLESLPKPDNEFVGTYVIYGEGCTVSKDRLTQANITFKQIPYQIEGA